MAMPMQAAPRVGQPRGALVKRDTLSEVRQRPARQTAHVDAGRLVTHHQRVWLGAVQQAEADSGVGGMEQRALPLDHVPVMRVGGRRQPFRGAGDEVGDHRVNADAIAGDEDAGLAGGAEICVEPRALIASVSASAVYILPIEQSVPTVSNRLPDRGSPVPTPKMRVG